MPFEHQFWKNYRLVILLPWVLTNSSKSYTARSLQIFSILFLTSARYFIAQLLQSFLHAIFLSPPDMWLHFWGVFSILLLIVSPADMSNCVQVSHPKVSLYSVLQRIQSSVEVIRRGFYQSWYWHLILYGTLGSHYHMVQYNMILSNITWTHRKQHICFPHRQAVGCLLWA